MSQPVKLSDDLVLDARVAGKALQRSIAGQVEFWASLGKALEPLLQGDRVIALCRSGAAQSLSQCLDDADSAKGRRRLKTYLNDRPFPHYEPAPEGGGLLVRIDADGTRTTGRFVKRKFRSVKARKPKSA